MRRCAGAADQGRQFEMVGCRSVGYRRRFCDHGQEDSSFGEPDTYRHIEGLSASGQSASVTLDDDVERLGPVAQSPRERSAEASSRRPVDDGPRRAVDNERCASAESGRFNIENATEVLANQRLELDTEQLAPPLPCHRITHLAHRQNATDGSDAETQPAEPGSDEVGGEVGEKVHVAGMVEDADASVVADLGDDQVC